MRTETLESQPVLSVEKTEIFRQTRPFFPLQIVAPTRQIFNLKYQSRETYK